MSAIDDLSELVENAAVAEKAALAAKWKDGPEVAAIVAKLERTAAAQQVALARDTDPDRLSVRWAALRHACVTFDPPTLPGTADEPLSREAAAQAESDAQAAVAIARLGLYAAAVAVVQARQARIRAGEDEPEARVTVDEKHPTRGRNPVSRHGPALAHGLFGEIGYILVRKPRTTVKSVAISLAMGLLYLGFIRVFQWDTKERLLPYLGLWVLSVVIGGQVCINAMSFDAMRVRAALESGERLWQILVTKNLALLCVVAPLGFLLSGVLAWQVGDVDAFIKACVLVLCFILLWLGVGNLMSIGVPARDEPLRKRRQSGSLKQFAVAFAISYVAGYLVNGILILRVFSAQTLYQKLDNVWVPGLWILLSCVSSWVLLTVFAVALAQQPRVRRTLQREIADYTAAAESRALADQPLGRVTGTGA